jgi:hypothetical protein
MTSPEMATPRPPARNRNWHRESPSPMTRAALRSRLSKSHRFPDLHYSLRQGPVAYHCQPCPTANPSHHDQTSARMTANLTRAPPQHRENPQRQPPSLNCAERGKLPNRCSPCHTFRSRRTSHHLPRRPRLRWMLLPLHDRPRYAAARYPEAKQARLIIRSALVPLPQPLCSARGQALGPGNRHRPDRSSYGVGPLR